MRDDPGGARPRRSRRAAIRLAPCAMGAARLLIAVWLVGTGAVQAGVLLDGVLAEVDGRVVTASDVALARGLGALGFQSSAAPIGRADVDRFVDGWLAVRAARRLGIRASPDQVAQAWEALARRRGGSPALDEWLTRSGIEPSWARAMVAADVERQGFIEARFQAFAFVSEDDVLAALGPGPHDAARRASVRAGLEREAAERGLARWIEEARREATIRHVLAEGATVPCPLPMPP